MFGSSHRGKAAGFIFTGFGLVVMLISALTSFSFFYTHFANLIPAGLLDSTMSRLVSGLVGMTLFDIATVIWLITYLHHSETSEQRATAMVLAIVSFVGAAAASVAYLGLNATGDLALLPETRQTIGLMALVTVILGIVANFGAAQAHRYFSLESKMAIREADRRDAVQQAEDEHAKYLDRLVAQNVKDQLRELAPDLAREQAARLAGGFMDRERSKYSDGGPREETRRPLRNPQSTIHYDTWRDSELGEVTIHGPLDDVIPSQHSNHTQRSNVVADDDPQ